jgi:lysophospholipase L1-like esterase
VDIILKQKSRVSRTMIAFVTIIVVLLVMFLYGTYQASAHGTVSDWSWTSPSPTVSDKIPADDVASQHCNGSYEQVQIVNENAQWMCVQQGEHIRVGMPFATRDHRTFVAFKYDTKMYPVRGTGSCEVHGECIYIPQSDTLVTKQNLVNVIVRSLVIYKDFTKGLTKEFDTLGKTVAYSFDSSHPDYTFKSSDNQPWAIEGLGVSNNGQWLVTEFRERGFGILDMNNLTMKRFSTLQLSYGAGSDPTMELAITNNGAHVALMGTNYHAVTLFDTGPGCQDAADDRNLQYGIPMAKPCSQLNVNSTSFINKFFIAYRPNFNDEGTALDFYAKSLTDNPMFVSLTTSGYVTPRLDYLALGDSFSSGEGEVDDTFYQPGTNDKFEKCHLSTRSYPYLIANMMGMDSTYVHSVACSGATTEDVVGADDVYLGQAKRLRRETTGLNDSERTLYQRQARNEFSPGRIHQITFVKHYKPKVITIGIGGNDVGFMAKLRSCVGLGTCEWAATAEGREKSALELQGAFDTLFKTYSAIHAASPTSHIYVIGYPKIIDASGQCSVLNGIILNTSERMFMNEGIMYINQIISAAAQRAGVKYIDIADSFGGRALCGSTRPSVMNAIRLGDDSPLSKNLGWLHLIGNESFHPKPTAHINIATQIMQSIPNMLSYDYCPALLPLRVTTCPDTFVTAPQPSSYWLKDDMTHGYDSQHIADFITDSVDSTDMLQKNLAVESYTFMPGSSVRAEIHSRPFSLGSAFASDSGAVSLNIKLPSSLEEGTHVIHVYGTSYSGEAIDLYQVFDYFLPIPDLQVNKVAGTIVNQPTDKTAQPEPAKQHSDSREPQQQIAYEQSNSANHSIAAAQTDVLGTTDKIDASATDPLVSLLLIIGSTLVITGLTVFVYWIRHREHS